MTIEARVCYVGGLGRSGSTLLELCLGALPGVCALGELVHVWERGVRDNQLCGCGSPFDDCPFWQTVGARAFGGWDRVDVDEVLALRRSVDRNRFVPRLLAPAPGTAFLDRVTAYNGLYRRIYAAALAVAGAEVVVDSSKHLSLACCLRRDPRLDLRVVHVTRDSRGVAHSWGRQVLRPEVADSVAYMPVYSAARSSALWLTQNALFEAVGRLGTARLHLRYEDFVAAPHDAVARAAQFLGVPVPEAPVAHVAAPASQVVLGASHTVAGNPMRFLTGPVTVRADDAWRREMPTTRRLLVGTVTYPLRRRYGYVDHAAGR